MIKTKLKKRRKVKRKNDDELHLNFVDKICIGIIILTAVGSIVVQHLPL